MDAYLHQPHEVSIETLALCNASCSFCPYPTLERKGTQLPDDVVYELIAQMSSWREPFFVAPFKVNEPLLDPRLSDICAAIETHCPNARIRLFTNGQPLVERHIEWIGRLERLEHLWVSLNEYDPQRYGELMKLSLSMTLSRLDRLHVALQTKTFRHRVIVSRVTDALTIYYSDRDVEFLKFVYDRWPLFTGRIIKRDSWLGYTRAATDVIPNAPCARWWELNICANGVAALCCMDGKGEFSIGSVHESSLLSLYNQPHLIERRRWNKSRQGIEPCQRCTY